MKSLRVVHASHSRRWRDFSYIYPVISRRSKGLSIGINLCPSGVCNFDCTYCQVERSGLPRAARVDLAVLASELRHMVANHRRLFDEPMFRAVPRALRRLNDIAFSGDGEPTGARLFPEAARLAANVHAEFGLSQTKIVVITNACFLQRPQVADALALLDRHNGEIWGKLDAGTEEYFRRVNRPSHSLQHVLDNILSAALIRPVVLQSLFMRLSGEPPPATEIAAYVERIRGLLGGGGRISLVQVYTVARQPAESYVSALNVAQLERIAAAVREAGVPVECYV
ncbi:MAG: radical SAM protein [Planctomycetes bacterium]|nr:radical SAM protein [Planctomycetota bacterium]